MIRLRHPPVLDPDFMPAEVWSRGYEAMVAADSGSSPLVIALVRPDGTIFRHETEILPLRPARGSP